jgi:hypothetical protein
VVLADDLGVKNATAQETAAPEAEPTLRARRHESRIRVHIPIRIIYQGLLNEVSRDGLCTDISEAGIGFQTHAGLYVGEIVEVEFRDQIAAALRFPVRVLYKMGSHFGAYFVSPDAAYHAGPK